MAHFFKKNISLSLQYSFLQMGHLASFSFIISLFQTNINKQFLQKIKVKNVHPKYGTGIQTHNLQMQVSSHNHWTRAPAQDQGSLQFSWMKRHRLLA